MKEWKIIWKTNEMLGNENLWIGHDHPDPYLKHAPIMVWGYNKEEVRRIANLVVEALNAHGRKGRNRRRLPNDLGNGF